MLRARLYLDGSKVVWALVQCAECREVHKYAEDEVILGLLACRGCGHTMDVHEAIRDAVAEWADAYPGNAEVPQALLRRMHANDGTASDSPARS